jgi:hypothetical protein
MHDLQPNSNKHKGLHILLLVPLLVFSAIVELHDTKESS